MLATLRDSADIFPRQYSWRFKESDFRVEYPSLVTSQGAEMEKIIKPGFKGNTEIKQLVNKIVTRHVFRVWRNKNQTPPNFDINLRMDQILSKRPKISDEKNFISIHSLLKNFILNSLRFINKATVKSQE